MTEIMKQELGAFENRIATAVSNVVPRYSKLIVNSKMFTDRLYAFEDFVEQFMDPDTGMVDGNMMGQALYDVMPNITKWINVPAEKFRLADIANDILSGLIGV